MNEMSERRSGPSAARTATRVAFVLIAIACGKATGPSVSSSSHWLVCEADVDCASAGPTARCAGDGYCVDVAGVRIRLPAESVPGAGDAERAGDTPDTAEPSAGECPERRDDPSAVCIDVTPRWARDPASGMCCRYDNLCDLPQMWFSFASEEECQTSCRCVDIDYGEPPTDFGTERISLECSCADGTCSMNIEDELARICDNALGVPWVRTEGCGMIEITFGGGFYGGNTIYDAATGALVGRRSFSDVAVEPCGAFVTIAGRAFECETVTSCALCGTRFDPSIPPCE